MAARAARVKAAQVSRMLEVDMASAIFRLADQARGEARELRERAAILEREATRLDSIGSALADGSSIEEALT